MAFQIRHRRGLRVYFQPFAWVTHAESTTYGGADSTKQKLLEAGKLKFKQKWSRVLAHHGPQRQWDSKGKKFWLRDHEDAFPHSTRL